MTDATQSKRSVAAGGFRSPLLDRTNSLRCSSRTSAAGGDVRKKAAGTLAPSPDLRLAAIQAWTALSGTTCVPNDNVSAVPNDTVAQQRPPAGLQAAIRWAAAHSTAKAESCDSSDDELDSQNEIARGTNCPAPKGSIDSQAIENGAESWHELSAATTSTSSASSCSSSRRGGVAASEASALSPLSVSVSSPALSSASCSSEAGAAHVRTLSSICCNSHHTSMEDSSMCGRSAQFAVQDYLMHLRSQIEQETGQVETTKQHLRLAEEGKEHEKRRANDLAERLAAVVVENNLIKKELEAAHREIEAADRRAEHVLTELKKMTFQHQSWLNHQPLAGTDDILAIASRRFG